MSTESPTGGEDWTIRRVLDWTINYLKERGSENPRLDAEVLLAHARNCQRIQLYTQFDEPLTEEQRSRMRELVKRRAAAEPVAYLVGHREFFSLDFLVQPGVFIPRPDTEVLVAAALDLLKPQQAPRVLELCTGSGCIPIALAKNHPRVEIVTVEQNPIPYAVARQNIERHQLQQRIELLQGDLFAPLPEGARFDMIVSNPPYVPADELPELQADVRDHEPAAALDGGPDGLDVIRRIIATAPSYLNPGGWLLFELDPAQSTAAQELLAAAGFTQISTQPDLSGQPRIVVGCLASS